MNENASPDQEKVTSAHIFSILMEIIFAMNMILLTSNFMKVTPNKTYFIRKEHIYIYII